MKSPSTTETMKPGDNDDTIPGSKSGGNEGARGSRGQANSGAQAGNSTNEQGNDRAPAAQDGPDLRQDPAQGGGGLASGSSRSEPKQQP